MQHLDEGTIHAWLDGALSTEKSAAAEAHVATCGQCAAAVAEARGLIAASSRIVSALDIVPGGVIPRQAAPVRRAWYSTTQFRAAAAVLFVAGASMLLVQGRDGGNVKNLSQQVMSTPSAETFQAQSANAGDEIASAPAEADARATTPPTMQAPAAVATMPLAKAIEGRAAGVAASTLDKVAITGAATESGTTSLRVARRDSTASARTTVFMVDSGVTVSLTESFTGVRAVTRARQLRDAVPSAAAATAPPTLNQSRGYPILSISWTDPVTGNSFTLSGPLPREKLEEIRKQIEAQEQGPR